MLCNWRFDNDYEEELLFRGGGVVENGGVFFSDKKRKVSKIVLFFGKVKVNGFYKDGFYKRRKEDRKRFNRGC